MIKPKLLVNIDFMSSLFKSVITLHAREHLTLSVYNYINLSFISIKGTPLLMYYVRLQIVILTVRVLCVLEAQMY